MSGKVAEAGQRDIRFNGHTRFDGLEVGRGLAAVFVLVSHVAAIMAEPRFYNVMIGGGRLVKLAAGVDFFFVLSGFIIAWAHWGDIGRRDRLNTYALRRFRRIFPPYWAILLPLSLAYLLSPGAGKASQHDPWNLLFSFTLLPYPAQPILGVAWTLVYEIIFYLVFGAIIWRGRPALVLLAVWGGAVIIANLMFTHLAFPFTIVLDSLNLEFLFGVSAAYCLRQYPIPMPRLLTVVGSVSFLAIMLVDYPVAANPLLMRIGYGLSAAVGVLGVVEFERTHGLAAPGFLKKLGTASYAIYLIHGVAISVAIQVLVRLAPRTLPLPIVLFALTGAGVVAGLLFHISVEKPLTRRRRGWPRRTLAPTAR